MLLEVADFEQAHAAGSLNWGRSARMATRSSTGIQQCTPCSGPADSCSGQLSRHCSRRYGQRGVNGQPAGSVMRFGGWPLIGVSRVFSDSSSRGSDASRPHVYGWCGVVEDLVHGPVLHRAPAVHDHDLVRDLGDDAEVVGDEDDAGVVLRLHLAHDVDDLRLDGHVERRRGLVGDQDVRVAADRHGDHRALAHAAGELERVLVDALVRVGDADAGQQGRGHAARPRSCPCPGGA